MSFVDSYRIPAKLLRMAIMAIVILTQPRARSPRFGEARGATITTASDVGVTVG
jgi:hypothetical protein